MGRVRDGRGGVGEKRKEGNGSVPKYALSNGPFYKSIQ